MLYRLHPPRPRRSSPRYPWTALDSLIAALLVVLVLLVACDLAGFV